MTLFLWTMSVVFLLEVIGKLLFLANGHFPARTPKEQAWSAFANMMMLVWTALLLVKHYGN